MRKTCASAGARAQFLHRHENTFMRGQGIFCVTQVYAFDTSNDIVNYFNELGIKGTGVNWMLL